jgi:uncharacterized protein YjiS (DUF1127 family)
MLNEFSALKWVKLEQQLRDERLELKRITKARSADITLTRKQAPKRASARAFHHANSRA